MTTRKPESDANETEQQPKQRRERAKQPPKFHISFCPEGKTGAREDRGNVPLDVDSEIFIEESAHCEPGLYRIDKRRAGEFSGETRWYTKEDATAGAVEFEGSGEGDDYAQSYDFEDRPAGDARQLAQLVAATVDAVLEKREQAKQAQAQQQPNALEIVREVEAARRRAAEEERERQKSSAAQQTDPLAMVERVVTIADKLRPQPAERDDNSPLKMLDLFTRMYEKVSDVSERVNPPEGGGGFGGFLRGAASVFDSLGLKEIIVPLGQGVMNAVLASRGIPMPTTQAAQEQPPAAQPPALAPAAQQEAQQPAQPPEMKAFSDALEELVDGIKTDLQEGNDAADAISDVIKLRTEMPALNPTIDAILQKSNDELLVMLSQATGADLSQIANAGDYLDELKAGVQARLKPRSVAPSNNGNGVHPPEVEKLKTA
ncbi:MAG TPA: hypothetical protein VGC87_23210 [Pyrinomonadaceae bacterium]|jgi:hypothetical protein